MEIPYIGITFIICTVLSAGYMAFQHGVVKTVAVQTSIATTSFIYILTFFLLLAYNKKLYRNKSFRRHVHSLTEIYQLSENIRTGRQLVPVFFLHFISAIVTTIFAFFLFYVPYWNSYWLSIIEIVTNCVGAIINFTIQSAIIYFHPLLNRKATLIFVECLKLLKIKVTAIEQPVNFPRTIDGAVLIKKTTEEANEYFRVLHDSWELTKL
uniref:Uncharacterized protein n=1 Tax=Ditylenchus dipsaci TaxID=166011 RepID=A0A915E5K2_9BILA